MFKKILTGLIDHPLLTSLFITDFALLLFINTPPFIFSFLMLSALVVMSAYFGQKLALFSDN